MINKKYDILDITKFILSFFVVAIHAEILPSLLYPWLRIAVPIFFVISSFLFFSGIKGKDFASQKSALLKYIKRNMKLYFVWFVILIPFTIMDRPEWFSNGLGTGILYFLRALLFGSTFRASWYITANVFATIFLFFVSKKTKRIFLFIFAIVCYLICCLATTYQTIGSDIITNISQNLFNGIATSTFSAIIWVFIGKEFAEGRLDIDKNYAIIGSVFFGVLLFFEHYTATNYLNANNATSCYLSLVFFSIFSFALILKGQKVHIKNAKVLRNMSTLIYVSHCAVLKCVSIVSAKILNVSNELLIFVVSCAFLIIATRILLCLYEKKKWNLLKILW